ncbi:pre-mRNA-splicing factor cwc24 [Arthroderma uncinatum]|uniref:pre-mRNA-splicing factor cwc24 n=1 Tax=Arthroderma uncinatum TaxID=74035 RepID=UPI00144A8C64|nr:pre-mRNA-splicing factor cwc24 [Arthroderma uncinatum]KAF3482503.1 pre-mRNA-splicing factor cwc24 [Arthroderma uncinatum]
MDEIVPAFKKRTAKAKSSLRKKTAPPASDSEDFTSSDDEQGHRIKRRRKNAGVGASSKTAAPKREEDEKPGATAERRALPTTNDATKQSNWYDEDLSEKNLLGNTRTRTKPEDAERADGTYRGASSYQSFIQKNPDAPSRQVGPMKPAATNIRTITVTDFAPDVCKDYKQTGFCGFGDNCKYLHAREDYKAGWELDRDWEIQTKGKKLAGQTVASRHGGDGEGEDEDEDDEFLESIPFACIICKQPYTSPIITKCGHYFCEACALKRYRKNPNCAACGSSTGGVFNVAKKLGKLLDRKRERARKRREQAIEAGEEVSEDDDNDE